jgi:hypothetical protein
MANEPASQWVSEIKDDEFYQLIENSSETSLNSNKGTVDNDKMSAYLTDSCDHFASNVNNEPQLRAQNLRRCRDGSASFVQPDSEGWGGYEGKCGQTAASNLMYSYCSLAGHPQNYANRFLRDLTPGVTPSTLRDGLRKMFKENDSACPQGQWKQNTSYNSHTFFSAIDDALSSSDAIVRKRNDGSTIGRAPVAALIRVPGSRDLHWITVVDLLDKDNSSCRVMINHWDSQFTVPCLNFAKWSYGVKDSYGPLLPAYTIIHFN